jgi:hypothetical protein
MIQRKLGRACLNAQVFPIYANADRDGQFALRGLKLKAR